MTGEVGGRRIHQLMQYELQMRDDNEALEG